jgi:outer membrane protein OmpA-like peptidoglycan-associated protein
MYWIDLMNNTIPNRLKIAGASAGLAFLMACAPSEDRVYSQFHEEAGAITDTGYFGNATLNNRLVQTGEREFTYELATRFAEEIDTMVTFDFNSARLDSNAQAILRQQAAWIRQFPEVRFKVFGHADAVGSNGYNIAIGKRRANAVVRYLGTQGISRSRLEAVVSHGESQPLIVTEGRERQNRRTVTEVSGFVGRHPTVLDGKYAQIIYRDYVESATAPSGLSDAFAATTAE